jgi:hypothetical protein
VQEAAWEKVQTLKKFDSGNSLSNSLYWVATRPPTQAKAGSPRLGKGAGRRRGLLDGHQSE